MDPLHAKAAAQCCQKLAQTETEFYESTSCDWLYGLRTVAKSVWSLSAPKLLKRPPIAQKIEP
jgi:hypothetical protein